MKRGVRWLRNGLLGLVVLIAIAAVVVYALSERTVGRRYADSPADISAFVKAGSAIEGLRLAQIRGCLGCHGSKLEGRMLIDHPLLGRIASPNLTQAVRGYSDIQLAHVIRQGIRPDSISVIVMPSGMFSQLTDADVGNIIAYMRSAPPVNGQERKRHLGPAGRVMFAIGVFKPEVVAVREADGLTSSFPQPGQPHAAGAYLARTSCTECHGVLLRGDGKGTPDLRIAAGYTIEQFTRLMRTGKALGDRELELMSTIARNRFSHFTNEEIAELHAYLLARAATPDSGRK